MTLRGLVAELGERGVEIELLRGLAVLRAMQASASKKSLLASEQDRPDVARRRARWKTHQGKLDPARLVFIDETWAKTNMTRSHGCAPRAGSSWPRCRTAGGER